MRKLSIPWTSSAAGAASFQIPACKGHLHRVVLRHPAGANQPAGYTISITDANPVKLVNARVVADVSVPDEFCPLNDEGVPFSLDEDIVVDITGAGNGKSGIVSVYIQE